MNIEVDWGNQEETILLMKVNGKIEADKLLAAQQQAIELAHTKVHRVDMIVDMRTALSPGSGLLPLARQAVKRLPTNLRRMAVITSTVFWSQIFKTLPQSLTGHIDIRFVESVDDAYAYLEVVNQS